MRIAVGGLLHETNTFSKVRTGRADFDQPTGWPRMTRGPHLVEDLIQSGVPAGGVLAVLNTASVTIAPTLWAMALPAGPVEQPVFDALVSELVTRLSAAKPLDGVFLDLHGAMVCTADDDPEGTVLGAVRAAIGPDVALVATLDPHANLSTRMFDCADALFVYRTYPHTDMRQTGERAAKALLALANGAPRAAKAYRAVPFHIPLVAQATGGEPMASLMAASEASAHTVEICFGFPLADVPAAGPAIAVYAADEHAAAREADAQLSRWLDAEHAFAVAMLTPDEAVLDAIREGPAYDGAGPVILADVQDNPGAGGSNDTTGLLTALIAAKADGAVLAHIVDKPAVDAAHSVGRGGTVHVTVGGRASAEMGAPVDGPWDVVALGDGAFTGEGPMYGGHAIAMGPVALLRRNGVGVIVAGKRMQASEPGLLRHLGVTPETLPILAVKSSVHFRGAYQEIARRIIHVAAPGLAPMDLSQLRYTKSARRVARAVQATEATQ